MEDLMILAIVLIGGAAVAWALRPKEAEDTAAAVALPLDDSGCMLIDTTLVSDMNALFYSR